MSTNSVIATVAKYFSLSLDSLCLKGFPKVETINDILNIQVWISNSLKCVIHTV